MFFCELQTDAFGVFERKKLYAMLYPDEILVTCMEGYASNKDKHDEKEYSLVCGSDGIIVEPKATCVPMDCGKMPKVKHATVKGSTFLEAC